MAETQITRRELFLDWHHRMHDFGNKNEREREEFLHEMEENMPVRLSEVKQCLRKFMEEGLEFVNTYNVLLGAHDLTIAMESASTAERIAAEQLRRLHRLKEQVKALYVLECRKSVNVVEFLRRWSSNLETWTSENGSEEELVAMLKTFEDWSKTAFIWPNILGNIKDLQKWFEEERWPGHVLNIFTYIVKGVQLFKTRLDEARAAPNLLGEARVAPSLLEQAPAAQNLEPIPLADRLHEMMSSLEDVLETKIAVQDLVIVSITVDPVKLADETITLEGTDHIESDRYCLTKRSVERVKDLLIKDSSSITTLNLGGGAEENLVREIDGKLNISISHDVPKTYTLYHIHLKDGDAWTRLSATLQNDQLCVTAELPPSTIVFFTSMKNSTKAILSPEKEYLHVCPENNDATVDIPKGTVLSSTQIRITLSECQFQLSEIAGYSDIVCIQHDEKFLKPVSVTLPVTMIGDNDITTCDLFCVHIGDDGVTIYEDVKVEILSGNVCRFATNTLGRHAINARKKLHEFPERNLNLESFSEQLELLHTPSPHIILLFIGAGYGDDTWKLHAEVVHQSQVKNTIEKRQTEMALFELPQSRSPSLIVSGIQQIDVVFAANGSLSVWEGAHNGRVTINIIQGAEDNFIQVPVTRTGRASMGIIHFKAAGREQILHSAFLSQDDMDRFSHIPALQRDAFKRKPPSKSHTASSGSATLVPSDMVNDFVVIPTPQTHQFPE